MSSSQGPRSTATSSSSRRVPCVSPTRRSTAEPSTVRRWVSTTSRCVVSRWSERGSQCRAMRTVTSRIRGCTLSTSSREVTGTATALSPTAAATCCSGTTRSPATSLPTGAGGACSAAVAAFGDFAPIQNHTYDNNLFVSSPAGYCMYAGYDPAKPYGKLTKNVQVINNVFQRGSSGKCAVYGLSLRSRPAATATCSAATSGTTASRFWPRNS